MMLNGYDVYFAVPAEQGDPDYVVFWDRVENKREKTVYNSVEEGLKALSSGQNVIHLSERMLKRYFLERPYIHQHVKVFAKGSPEFKTIIVTLNSPLKPILELGFRHVMQSGTSYRILSKWEGPDIVEVPVETMVLNVGQVILCFMIVASLFTIAASFFVLELLWARIKDIFGRMKNVFFESKIVQLGKNFLNPGFHQGDKSRLFEKRDNFEARLLRSIPERNTSFI